MSADRGPKSDEAGSARSPYGGLCATCAKVRVIKSDRGSTFVMCRESLTDSRYSKYPPQPVRSCPAFERLPSRP